MTCRHSEALITAVPRSQSPAAAAPPAPLEFSVVFSASPKKYLSIFISFYALLHSKNPRSQHFWGVAHPLRQEHSLGWDALAFPENVVFTPSWARSHPLVAFGISLLQRDSLGSFWGCGNAGFVLIKEIKGWELEKKISVHSPITAPSPNPKSHLWLALAHPIPQILLI